MHYAYEHATRADPTVVSKYIVVPLLPKTLINIALYIYAYNPWIKYS